MAVDEVSARLQVERVISEDDRENAKFGSYALTWVPLGLVKTALPNEQLIVDKSQILPPE